MAWGPRLVRARVAWGPRLVRVRVAWGPRLPGCVAISTESEARAESF